MSPRQRVLVALWLAAGIQAAAWSIDYAVRRVRRALQPTVPVQRLGAPPTSRRSIPSRATTSHAAPAAGHTEENHP